MTDTQPSMMIEQDPTEAWLSDMEKQLEVARLSNESEQQELDVALEAAVRELEAFTQETLILVDRPDDEEVK